MPLITFESGRLDDDVKTRLIREITDLSSAITGIPKGSFFVSIRELPDENIAIGGRTVKELKKESSR